MFIGEKGRKKGRKVHCLNGSVIFVVRPQPDLRRTLTR